MHALVVGSVLLVLAGAPVSTLEEALDVLAAGDSLAERVPRSVGVAAAARIDPSLDGVEVEDLAQVAWEAGAYLNAATRLVEVVAAAGPGAEVAVVFLNRLRPETLDLAVRGREERWLKGLRSCCERGGVEAWELLGRHVDPALLARWIRAHLSEAEVLADDVAGFEEDDARWLLEAASSSRWPARGVDAFADLDVPAELQMPLAATLTEWVERDRAAALNALQRIEAGRPGAGGVLLRSLGGVPVELRDRAEAAVLEELEAWDVDLLEAAIAGGVALELSELPVLLTEIAIDHTDVAARVSAIEAFAAPCAQDEGTVRLLVGLLRDGHAPVRSAAHSTLVQVTGEEIANRAEIWAQWSNRGRGQFGAGGSFAWQVERSSDAESESRSAPRAAPGPGLRGTRALEAPASASWFSHLVVVPLLVALAGLGVWLNLAEEQPPKTNWVVQLNAAYHLPTDSDSLPPGVVRLGELGEEDGSRRAA